MRNVRVVSRQVLPIPVLSLDKQKRAHSRATALQTLKIFTENGTALHITKALFIKGPSSWIPGFTNIGETALHLKEAG